MVKIDIIVKNDYQAIDKMNNLTPEKAANIILNKYCSKKSLIKEIGKDYDFVSGAIDKWLIGKKNQEQE